MECVIVAVAREESRTRDCTLWRGGGSPQGTDRRVRREEPAPALEGRKVLVLALPGSEDEQPLEETPNEFERVAWLRGWNLRDRATAQQSQEDSELRARPATAMGMRGRAGPGARPAPAEGHFHFSHPYSSDVVKCAGTHGLGNLAYWQ